MSSSLNVYALMVLETGIALVIQLVLAAYSHIKFLDALIIRLNYVTVCILSGTEQGGTLKPPLSGYLPLPNTYLNNVNVFGFSESKAFHGNSGKEALETTLK